MVHYNDMSSSTMRGVADGGGVTFTRTQQITILDMNAYDVVVPIILFNCWRHARIVALSHQLSEKRNGTRN